MTNQKLDSTHRPTFQSASVLRGQASQKVRRQARDVFDRVPLTEDLEREEQDVVVSAVEICEAEPGEILLKEGEVPQALFFIETGSVDVVKADEDQEHRFTIATLEAGDFFGEMSFIDEEPASATIEATEDARIWRLPKGALMEQGDPGESVYHHLVANVTKTISERLRSTNTSLTESLREQLEQERLRNQFGHFFIAVIMVFGILSLGTALLSAHMSPVQEVAASWAYMLTFLLPLGYYVRYRAVSFKEFGFTLERWPQQVTEGVTCAALLTLLMIPVKTQFYTGDALFTFETMQNYSPALFWAFFALYLPHSFLQELIARGLIQGSLHRFMAETADWVPVLVASFLFGIGHVHYSYGFAGLTFLTSLLFGGLYLRHRSLLGVTLVHYLSGLSAVAMGIF